jgi:hypothetical protein
MNLKRYALAAALLATLAAAWWAPAPTPDDLASPPATRLPEPRLPATTALPSRSASAAAVVLLAIAPRASGAAPPANLFTAPAPPPAPRVAKVVKSQPVIAALLPEPAPQAPPLPFQFLGRYKDAGQVAIFLQHADQNLVVRVGDVLQGQYKVESLTDTALHLIYLPLNQPQTLTLSAAP